MKPSILFSLSLIVFLFSCTSVASYERQYVSDSEMQMNSDAGQTFNNYVQSIREGAAPAEGKKSSGGCGCN